MIELHWTDHRGQTILKYDGVGFDFRAWITADTEWVGRFFGQPACGISEGQADFNGWQLVKLPCNDPLALDYDYRMASGTVGLEVLTPVPEPAPAALLLAGLATLAWRLRQRCGRDGG